MAMVVRSREIDEEEISSDYSRRLNNSLDSWLFPLISVYLRSLAVLFLSTRERLRLDRLQDSLL